MAVSTYTVKRGDTLWEICGNKDLASSIAGNTRNAKIETLIKLNNIKKNSKGNPLIYTGQVLKLSGTADTKATTTTTPSSSAQKALIDAVALQADDKTGRALVALWSWSRSNTANYKYRWLQWIPSNGKWTLGNEGTTSSYEAIYCFSEWTADELATKVKFEVLPVAKNKSNNKPYWKEGTGADDVAWASKEYDFANNPPLPPESAPDLELDKIDDTKLIMSYEDLDAKKLDAKYVRFNVVKNNTSSIYTSPNIEIQTVTDGAYYVSHQYTVPYGGEYKVRACTVGANGKTSAWSEFSNTVGTKPVAPKAITTCRRNKRTDGTISAFLVWSAVTNATSYIIEYVTVREDFENAPGNVQKSQTEDARTSVELTGIEVGHEYFFRIRAVNENGQSEPSPIVSLPVGEPPAAPTTWSSSNSAFVGETMELNWTHNSRDGSTQSFAELGLKIGNADWQTFVFENTTTEHSGEEIDIHTFTYGQAVSYKGELHVKIDTAHAALKNAKIQWRIRTAGVTDAFSDTDWSVDRTIYIYEKPILALSVSSDLAGMNVVETLTSFPFYIRGEVELDSYEVQRPIGYHLRVIANDTYETVDDAGRTKTVNPGDAVYSKYFDVIDLSNPDLIVVMSAENVDLEPTMTYTIECAADMSTGLSVEQSYDIAVSWSDVTYAIGASIHVNSDSYTAAIIPSCRELVPLLDEDGNAMIDDYGDPVTGEGDLVDNVTLSVYRREYNGTLTEIATNIPNNGTAVTDLHPALDYARYRIIARDANTGSVSFYDMAGERVGCNSVIIQWDEAWTQFDASAENSAEAPLWTGSMLVLPYNVKISDSRKREVSRVAYAGREYAVSYHGTLIEEGSSWSTVIPKDDVETIYALRRLSMWAGPAYIREPSGMGFWALVVPTFNIDHDSLTIPVSLDVTRVEGGA